MTNLSRRSLFGMGVALIASPAIVRISSLMPIKAERTMTLAVYASGLDRRLEREVGFMLQGANEIMGDLVWHDLGSVEKNGAVLRVPYKADAHRYLRMVIVPPGEIAARLEMIGSQA